MTVHYVERRDALHDGYMKAFEVGGRAVLLIQQHGVCHAVGNRCGHFGVPLDTGSLQDGAIACSQHGIAFSLTSGEIVNRPWENADPIPVYRVVLDDDRVGIEVAED